MSNGQSPPGEERGGKMGSGMRSRQKMYLNNDAFPCVLFKDLHHSQYFWRAHYVPGTIPHGGDEEIIIIKSRCF